MPEKVESIYAENWNGAVEVVNKKNDVFAHFTCFVWLLWTSIALLYWMQIEYSSKRVHATCKPILLISWTDIRILHSIMHDMKRAWNESNENYGIVLHKGKLFRKKHSPFQMIIIVNVE